MSPLPFEKNRLDYRCYKDRIDKPYYGGDLRRLLDKEPEAVPSWVERFDLWWYCVSEDHPFLAACAISIAVTAVTAIIMVAGMFL